MATIRKNRSKWQVLIRKHNLKTIYKTYILKEDAVKWPRETEVKIEQGIYKYLRPLRSSCDIYLLFKRQSVSKRFSYKLTANNV